MATPVWLSVFVFLCIELVITALLVMPLPRIVRRSIAHLAYKLRHPSLRFIIRFVALGLIIAIVDSYNTLSRLSTRLPDFTRSNQGQNQRFDEGSAGIMEENMTRSRKFRAERNTYLSLFTLVLMYAIKRMIVLIMMEIETENEIKDLEEKVEMVGKSRRDRVMAHGKEGSEMKDMGEEIKARNASREVPTGADEQGESKKDM